MSTILENRRKNFEYLMHILDEAEGVRDSAQGAFSFLKEDSYVREVVVTPNIKTSIAGLKTFLATEVLEIFRADNRSKVSYKNIQDHLSGNTSKKYSFFFDVLDEVFDIEKNKQAFLERCWILSEHDNIRYEIKNTDNWLPYLLIEKLRDVVWKKLRKFFKSCEQETCSECLKKNEMYFQFIQAVALYEIFLSVFIQEKGSAYIEESMELTNKMINELTVISNKNSSLEISSAKQSICIAQEILSEINAVSKEPMEKLSSSLLYIKIYQILKADFGISYNAMCYLLMIFEAMNACTQNMRGIKKISLKILRELEKNYEKELYLLQNHNKKREKRYKQINKKLEDIMEKYAGEEFDTSVVVVTFLEELCRPKDPKNINILRGLECKLGYPVYRDLGGTE